MKISKLKISLLIFNICFACIGLANIPTLKSIITAYKEPHSKTILELCDTYINNSSKFRYGYKHAAFRKEVIPIDGKFEINCSTFSMLIALGIGYENSSYAGGDNSGVFQNEYATHLQQWFSDSIDYKYSYDMAKKIYIDGHSFLPNEDYTNLKTGDILFFNLNPSNDTSEKYFMGVDHSAIFGYKIGNKYLIYEVGDDKGPQEILKSNVTMSKIVLVGRLP